jgi:hypothetical protein
MNCTWCCQQPQQSQPGNTISLQTPHVRRYHKYHPHDLQQEPLKASEVLAYSNLKTVHCDLYTAIQQPQGHDWPVLHLPLPRSDRSTSLQPRMACTATS